MIVKEIKIQNKDLKYHTHNKTFYIPDKKFHIQPPSFALSKAKSYFVVL